MEYNCPGATIGALYGILYGKDALPAKWIEPLGDTVVISKEIKNIALPHNLQQLTEEVCQMGQRVLDFFQAPIEIGEEDSSDINIDIFEEQIAPIQQILNRSPNELVIIQIPLQIRIEYDSGAAILPDLPNKMKIILINQSAEQISGSLKLKVPKDWHSPLKEFLNFQT